MKIAMLGHKHFPSTEGGVETVVGELAVRMVNAGEAVTLFNRSEPGRKAEPSEYEGVCIGRAPTLSSPKLNAMLASVTGMARASSGGFDIIHVHAEGFNAMDWLPSMKRIPVVTTIHGLDWQRDKWGGFATKYLKYAERCAVKRADRIIVLSRNMQSYFSEQYGRETLYIPNGIDPIRRRGESDELERLGLEPDGYVLFLGRFAPEKRAELLIEAWRSSGCAKKLVLAGDMSSDYAKSVKALCPEAVTPGFVAGRLREQLYENCALFVLPSSLEGMSMALLEALSSGCRVLASDIPENTEAMEGMGFLFESGSSEALARGIVNALASPHDPNAQAERISSLHSWDGVVRATLDVYADAIASHRGDKGITV